MVQVGYGLFTSLTSNDLEFSLISAMRAHDVQPIVIWDQRGTRTWKAAEVCSITIVVAGPDNEIRRGSDLRRDH